MQIGAFDALAWMDADSRRHSMAVGRDCVDIGRELGLDARTVRRLAAAGVVHDIGKLWTHESVLRKRGPLDEADWIELRRHPVDGARLLARAGLDDLVDWVLHHHERPDGRGYPYGLSGEQIPLGARIIAVADAYDAMTSPRAYRPAVLTPEEAGVELARGAGTQFDEPIVSTFMSLPGRQAPELPGRQGPEPPAPPAETAAAAAQPG